MAGIFRRGSGAAGRGALWQNGDFLRFWAGETISLFGSQVTVLALPLTAVLALNATPGEMGVLSAARFLPFLLLTLPVGVWVDRVRRRPLLIWANLGRGLLLGLVPLVAWLGGLRMIHLYVVGFLLGSMTVLFDMAYGAFLPALVTREHLLEGNSKMMTSASAAEVGGPGLGGILVQAFGAPLALLVDAASFFVSAFNLMAIRAPETAVAAVAGETAGGAGEAAGAAGTPGAEAGAAQSRPLSMWRQIVGGLRLTFGNPYLRAIAGEAATYNLFSTMVETLLALYAVRELGMSPGLLGVVLAVGSIGALIGSVLAGWAVNRLGIGPAVAAAMVLASTAPLGIPAASGSTLAVSIVLAAALFVGGIGLGASNVHVGSLRQTMTPDHLLGRVNASYRFFIYAGIPLGALLSGWLGELLGLRTALWIGAGALVFAPLWVLASPILRLRSLSGTAAQLAPAHDPALG